MHFSITSFWFLIANYIWFSTILSLLIQGQDFLHGMSSRVLLGFQYVKSGNSSWRSGLFHEHTENVQCCSKYLREACSLAPWSFKSQLDKKCSLEVMANWKQESTLVDISLLIYMYVVFHIIFAARKIPNHFTEGRL